MLPMWFPRSLALQNPWSKQDPQLGVRWALNPFLEPQRLHKEICFTFFNLEFPELIWPQGPLFLNNAN